MARGEWDDADDEAPATGTRALERAMQETRTVYRQADAAYTPYSCAASGECCQLAVTKRQPWLWLPEWEVLTRGRPLPPLRADGGCPFLDAAGKRCTVYEDRPFGCRTFFCSRIQGPARQPSDEVTRLLLRLERISQRVMPSLQGPRPLLEWYAGVNTAPAREER